MTRETTAPVTERVLVRLLIDVHDAAGDATTVHEVLHVTLELICAHTRWPVGHVYTPAKEAPNELILTDAQCLEDPTYFESLRPDGEADRLVPGDGVIGRAFRTGKPVWSSDVPTNFGQVPTSVVEEFDVHALLAIPGVGKAINAVLVFFVKDADGPDDLFLDALGHVGRQIGRTIDHLREKAAWQESEERFRMLVEDVQDYAIFMLDPEGHVVSWNKGAARIKGYQKQEIIGQHFSRFYPRDALETHVPERHLEVAAAEGRVEDENWRIRKDGSRFWASVVITALRGDEGELRGYAKVTRDLTERRRATEELQRREAHFRALIENALDIITVIDGDGVIRYQSPSIERILGYRQDELVGMAAFEHVHPDDVAEVRRVFATLLEKPGFTTSLEFRFRHKDGTWCTLESIGKNLLDDPVVEGIVVNSRDITDRRKAEDALRRSEERYRALAESSKVGIWHITEDGYTIYANDAMCALLEVDGPEALAGTTFHEFFTADSLTKIEHEHAKRRRGIASTYEAEIVGKHGRTRTVIVSGAPVSIRSDDVQSFIATFTDITERVQAEERLQQSEMQLAEAQRLAHIGSWEWDVRRDTITWSDELYRIYGLERGEFSATYDGFLERVHEDDRDRVDRVINQALEDGTSFRFEHRIVRPDGAVRILQGRGEVIVDEDGRPRKIIGTGQDITERIETEEARRESEARFRTVFEESAFGISVVDLSGRIVEANPALQQLLGYTREELRGTTFSDVTHPADVARNVTYFDELAGGDRERYQMEKRYLRKDESVIWARITVTLVRDSHGEPTFTIGMIEDISEQKQLEAELNEVQQKLMEGREAERTHLARELHDGPIQDLQGMNFQLGTLSKMLNGDVDRSHVTEIQTSLREAIRTLRTICGELRPPTLAPFGLEAAIRSHADEFRKEHADLEVHLDLMYDGQLLSEQMRLAFFRIYQQAMDNVIQHAGAQQVTVRFRFDANEVVLAVEDDGRGFSVPRRWTTYARQGHLGLAGAAERAAATGGSLDVTSEPGHGTTVRVVAPRDDTGDGKE